EGAGAAIVRTAFVQPAAIITHEIAEAAILGVPGMIDEASADVGEAAIRVAIVSLMRKAREQAEGAGVVVDAIAMAAIRDAELGVLQYAAVIGDAVDRRKPRPEHCPNRCSFAFARCLAAGDRKVDPGDGDLAPSRG